MKGPSLEAIRKFKEQQERKKIEENERKIKEKLSTLEHRAAQGDRKAKSTLNKLEKIDKVKNTKTPAPAPAPPPKPEPRHIKQKASELNFDELMKMAKQNNNPNPQPKVEAPKADPVPKVKPVQKLKQPLKVIKPPSTVNPITAIKPQSSVKQQTFVKQQPPTLSQKVRPHPPNLEHMRPTNNQRHPVKMERRVITAPQPESTQKQFKPIGPRYKIMGMQRNYYDDDYEDDDYEDEDDGFIVDEDDDEAADELDRTLKSVFNYDKRRCDRREAELDRQYRAIGRVNTFEDLEREERRASRIAAAEDAKAQREEDERKRLKALKKQKHR